jgi:dTDP-glucose 4,6-dehydratase
VGPGVPGGVYNVRARNERRNLEVPETNLRAVGKPASLIRFV